MSWVKKMFIRPPSTYTPDSTSCVSDTYIPASVSLPSVSRIVSTPSIPNYISASSGKYFVDEGFLTKFKSAFLNPELMNEEIDNDWLIKGGNSEEVFSLPLSPRPTFCFIDTSSNIWTEDMSKYTVRYREVAIPSLDGGQVGLKLSVQITDGGYPHRTIGVYVSIRFRGGPISDLFSAEIAFRLQDSGLGGYTDPSFSVIVTSDVSLSNRLRVTASGNKASTGRFLVNDQSVNFLSCTIESVLSNGKLVSDSDILYLVREALDSWLVKQTVVIENEPGSKPSLSVNPSPRREGPVQLQLDF